MPAGLAIGLLGGILASKLGGSNNATADPKAPTPLLGGPPTPPTSTAQDASAAIPAAQNAATVAKKRAAAGDTLLTAAQTPTQTAQPQVQPVRLLGK